MSLIRWDPWDPFREFNTLPTRFRGFFDKDLRQPPPLFGLDRTHKSLAPEVGPLGRMAIVVAHHKEFGGRFHRVGAQEPP